MTSFLQNTDIYDSIFFNNKIFAWRNCFIDLKTLIQLRVDRCCSFGRDRRNSNWIIWM